MTLQQLLSAGLLFSFFLQISAQNVTELNDKNFQSTLDSTPSLMVDFYASWCGHCQRFAPVYESLAETLQDRESPTRLFKIDAFKYPSIRAHWEIHGFPTLEYFYNGEMIERFSGKRSLKALNNFIKKQEKKFGLIS